MGTTVTSLEPSIFGSGPTVRTICFFVLSRPSLTLQRQKAVVQEWFDKRLSIRFKGKDLEYKEVDTVWSKPTVRVFAMKIRRKPPQYILLPTHPWKRGPVVQSLR
jgi:hypothetical protein